MFLRIYFIFAALILFSTIGCISPKDQDEVAQREHAVLLREQKMAALEDEYQALLRMRDSIMFRKASPGSDTLASLHSWPEALTGDWNSKVVCKVSGCSNYVIGDQRNELWRFQTDSTGHYVQVIINKKEVRRFKGEYDGQQVILSLVADSTAGLLYDRKTVLSSITPRLATGDQHLLGPDKCETVFSVELTPKQK